MSIELPGISAIMARLPEPRINLAAYSGIVFPLALIIEAPVIMLLAASTALSKDRASYQLLRRYMLASGALLTALHILIAFTPLYYWVAGNLLGAPPEIIEPARAGLMIMTPWTWSIAYRRFNQGVLIRFEHAKAVGLGTVVRLGANWVVLLVGYWIGTLPGIIVGTSAVAAGVISEAIYVGLVSRPVLQSQLELAPAITPPLTWNAFWIFYIPLVMTSLLTLLTNPIGSAAMSRMPQAISSLATWGVVSGLVFMLRSMGIAFNEVVVALLDQPYSSPSLRRFSSLLSAIGSLVLLLIVATPLSTIWFEQISALPPDLAELARNSLWIALPLPLLSVLQSWYQGAILHGRRTGSITESVVIYLIISALILGVGVWRGQITGLYVGMLAFTASMLIQTAWLWFRSRAVINAIYQRDTQPAQEIALQ